MNKIQNDIPIPLMGKRGGKRKWLFYDMEKGESVLIKANGGIHTIFSRLKAEKGWRFITRSEPEGMTRVWRIE